MKSIPNESIESVHDLVPEVAALYKEHDDVMKHLRVWRAGFLSSLPFVLVLNLLEGDFAGFVGFWLLGPGALAWAAPAIGFLYWAIQAAKLRSRIDEALETPSDDERLSSDAGAA